MPKYKVIFKGTADDSQAGEQAFLERFARAYNLTPDQARERIKTSRGVLYRVPDQAGADKAGKFLESIGAIAVVEPEGPVEVPPPVQAPPPLAGGPPMGAAPLIRLCPRCGDQVRVNQNECPTCHLDLGPRPPMPAGMANAAVAPTSFRPGTPVYAGPLPRGAGPPSPRNLKAGGYSKLADPSQRFWAFIIDVGIFFLVLTVAGSPMSVASKALGEAAAPVVLILWLMMMAFLLYYWFYLPAFDNSFTGRGQTFGKKTMGIKIIKTDGTDVTLATILARTLIGYNVASLFFGAGFANMFYDPQKQGWHDKIASTYVIKAP